MNVKISFNNFQFIVVTMSTSFIEIRQKLLKNQTGFAFGFSKFGTKIRTSPLSGFSIVQKSSKYILSSPKNSKSRKNFITKQKMKNY